MARQHEGQPVAGRDSGNEVRLADRRTAFFREQHASLEVEDDDSLDRMLGRLRGVYVAVEAGIRLE